ncbi:Orf22 [Canine mastadenovirus A]|uniref:Orf22 n=1 Tax=Canine mastadenovirus A TaxID=10537 RepID=A0A1J0MUM3_9ADEN|nr:orf22 [Canine mastadenovirus A]AXE71638.1 Orf22 [Canine mastadenovirus A]
MAMTKESVDQVEVNCLCVQHGQSCNNTRCFVKEGLRANWFYNPVLEEFAIPDSYQEGHGVNVKITFSHRSRNLRHNGHDVICSYSHLGSHISIRCTCNKPRPHLSLIEAACSMYNLD